MKTSVWHIVRRALGLSDSHTTPERYSITSEYFLSTHNKDLSRYKCVVIELPPGYDLVSGTTND